MKGNTRSIHHMLFGLTLLAFAGCAALPSLVPTAVPLPSPTPTPTPLPARTEPNEPTATPTLPPTATAVEPAAPTPTPTATAFACPNAPPPRLQVGDTGRVTFTDGLPLRIRETPEVSENNIVTQITEGAVFLVIGGPVCTPIPGTETAFVFWEIELEASGLSGWVAEGDESAYYIEPIP